MALTQEAASRRPDLVVWPETATPFYFVASPKLTRMVTDAVRQAGTYLLAGSPSVDMEEDRQAYYNSAYLVTPEGHADQRYDKVHLVPFGEYVPLKRILSFAGKMVAQVGDFSAGEKGRTLAWKEGRAPIGVQICFEIIFPGFIAVFGQKWCRNAGQSDQRCLVRQNQCGVPALFNGNFPGCREPAQPGTVCQHRDQRVYRPRWPGGGPNLPVRRCGGGSKRSRTAANERIHPLRRPAGVCFA